MNNEIGPLDADELMGFADRIGDLPPDDFDWASRLFHECMRARMREAELLEKNHIEETKNPDTADRQGRDIELAQVALDAAEWLKTLWDVGYMGAGNPPAQPHTSFPMIGQEDVVKSSLFTRIREGKRPLPFPPPTRKGLPWHDLVEGGSEVHDVEAEIVRNEQGGVSGAIIDGCADWRIIEEAVRDREYVIQHRGKGPQYRLRLDLLFSTLRREPPYWEKQIRFQERGDVRSYTLLWTNPDGTAQEITLCALSWERAESEAAYWIAMNYPEMYGQVSFKQIGPASE